MTADLDPAKVKAAHGRHSRRCEYDRTEGMTAAFWHCEPYRLADLALDLQRERDDLRLVVQHRHSDLDWHAKELAATQTRAEAAERETERLRDLCASYASNYSEPEVVARLHAALDSAHAEAERTAAGAWDHGYQSATQGVQRYHNPHRPHENTGACPDWCTDLKETS